MTTDIFRLKLDITVNINSQAFNFGRREYLGAASWETPRLTRRGERLDSFGIGPMPPIMRKYRARRQSEAEGRPEGLFLELPQHSSRRPIPRD